MISETIGKNLPRTDGYAKVTGKQRYTQDMTFPDMMYAVVLRSPYPHANIVKIDTSKAEAMGAVCLTYDDINPIMYNERSVSVPDATYRDKTVLPKTARFFGEPIAAVACDTLEDACKAIKLLDVTYDVLEAVLDPREAMKDSAPQLYDTIYLGDKPVKIKNNIGVIRNIDEGDCDAGFAEADRIFEREFKLNRIYHAQLETKGAVCAIEPDGSLTVYATAQSIHANRQLLGRVLNMPLSKINVKKITLGGAFGSSIQVNTLTPICAALALKARRAVKLIGSREEDFYSHQKYPTEFKVKMGVTNDGILTAAHVTALVDFGAHQIQPMAYMGCTAGWFASLYKYSGNIRFDGTAVYTNKTPCCAMQGYGNPQVNFAVESMIDIICDEMGFSPVDFRLKNYRGIGSEFWGQGPTIRSIIKSCGVEESLVKGRVITNFDAKKHPSSKSGRYRSGIGLARGFHTSGTGGPKEGEVIDYSSCMIKINEDGSVDVVSAVMDHGGGTWDALAKIAAEALSVPFNMVSVYPDAGTRDTGYDVCTHATRGVYCGGAAVYHVAMKVKELILNMAGEFMREHAYNLELVRSDSLNQAVIQVKNFPDKSMTLGEVAKLAQINSKGTIAFTDSYRQRNCPPCFTTHFVELTVDTQTGKINIDRVLIYGDCGTAVNPELVKGQLIGSFNRGLGYTVYEKLDYDDRSGRLTNNGLLVDYKTPSSVEMPDVKNCRVEICNTYEPSGPFGAKGIGEAALASVQAAIANAVYNAIGIRFYELPLTPERVLAAIKEKHEQQDN